METDNLNKDQLFEVMKNKSKTSAKKSCWAGIAWIILFIAFIIVDINKIGFNDLQYKDISLYICMMLFACLTGWTVLIDCRFLWKADSYDTPERLLKWHENKFRYVQKSSLVCQLVFLCFITGIIIFNYRNDISSLVMLLIVMVAVFVLFWHGAIGSHPSNPNKEIIEQLQDLVEKE